MTSLSTIHPTINIDHSVEQKNESMEHWAVKAAIVERFQSDPSYVGTIETERKTGELIADVRCCLSSSPRDVPQQFVVEIETPASNKDRYRATVEHLRYGYAVYWVFTDDAVGSRSKAEERLGEYMSAQPAFGVASLTDGELSLGSPITWDEFEYDPLWLGQSELRVPTYNRYKSWYNHGDFLIKGERVSIYRQPGRQDLFISRYHEERQQTLPERRQLSASELCKGLRNGDIKRFSPVRGPP